MPTDGLEVTDSPQGIIAARSLSRTQTYSLQCRGKSPMYFSEGASEPATDDYAGVLMPAPETYGLEATSANLLTFRPKAGEDFYVWTNLGKRIRLTILEAE